MNMRFKILIISLLSVFNIVYCQQEDHLQYFDEDWVETDKLKEACYIKNVTIENDTSFRVKVYGSKGSLLMNGTFSQIFPIMPDGYFEFSGINKLYDKCSGYYSKGEIIGEWKLYTNDSIRSVNYDCVMLDTLNDDSVEDEIWGYHEMPKFRDKDPILSFREYIREEQFYPPFEDLYKIQERIIVNFEITKEGQLVNPIILRGINQNLAKDAIRILLNSPNWSDNMKYSVQFTFPANYENNFAYP